MKKSMISVSIALLLASIVYILWRVTASPLWLSDMSVEAKNPVTFNWFTISIDTKVIEPSRDESVYTFSLLPVYIMATISLILVAFSFKKNK
ncbi:hypothetical protein [Mechercharimyces sp. CAU 1602]|uniref:hypothetical protein n=1 Tax=Mechercharimyces sp. CAU 1602 TaxID=2973933 RepID=UPI002161A41F|nr:hypothetical protein [Mechercharimyces sp. CAU 1602]MCS1351701.1 hypothetical protein [Mechercharimyces sp. CAU 1602]